MMLTQLYKKAFLLWVSAALVLTFFSGVDSKREAIAKADVVRKKIVLPQEVKDQITENADMESPAASADKAAQKHSDLPDNMTKETQQSKKVTAVTTSQVKMVQPKADAQNIVRKKIVLPPQVSTSSGPIQAKESQTEPPETVDKSDEQKVDLKGRVEKGQKSEDTKSGVEKNKTQEETVTVVRTVDQTESPKKQAEGEEPDIEKKESGQDEEMLTASISDTITDSIFLKDVKGYDPAEKVDPFRPLIEEEKKEKGKKTTEVVMTHPQKKKENLTPLEKVDLSQLKLVGIVITDRGNKALVEETSGKGYIISKGTPIGINSGKVVQILKDQVIVEEEITDHMNNVSMQERILKLPKGPGDEI